MIFILCPLGMGLCEGVKLAKLLYPRIRRHGYKFSIPACITFENQKLFILFIQNYLTFRIFFYITYWDTAKLHLSVISAFDMYIFLEHSLFVMVDITCGIKLVHGIVRDKNTNYLQISPVCFYFTSSNLIL